MVRMWLRRTAVTCVLVFMVLRTARSVHHPTAGNEYHTGHADGERYEAVSYDALKTGDSVGLVLMFAPWCSACKQLMPTWEALRQEVERQPLAAGRGNGNSNNRKGATKDSRNVKGGEYSSGVPKQAGRRGTISRKSAPVIGMINCDEDMARCRANRVTRFPTVLSYSPGRPPRTYAGPLTLRALLDVLELLQAPPIIQAQDGEDLAALTLQHKVCALYVGAQVPRWFDAVAWAFHGVTQFAFISAPAAVTNPLLPQPGESSQPGEKIRLDTEAYPPEEVALEPWQRMTPETAAVIRYPFLVPFSPEDASTSASPAGRATSTAVTLSDPALQLADRDQVFADFVRRYGSSPLLDQLNFENFQHVIHRPPLSLLAVVDPEEEQSSQRCITTVTHVILPYLTQDNHDVHAAWLNRSKWKEYLSMYLRNDDLSPHVLLLHHAGHEGYLAHPCNMTAAKLGSLVNGSLEGTVHPRHVGWLANTPVGAVYRSMRCAVTSLTRQAERRSWSGVAGSAMAILVAAVWWRRRVPGAASWRGP